MIAYYQTISPESSQYWEVQRFLETLKQHEQSMLAAIIKMRPSSRQSQLKK
jgi:hypothetical protein